MRDGRVRSVASWVVWWVAAAAAWAGLTGSLAPPELGAGAVAATLATIAVQVVQNEGLARLRARPGLLRPVLGLPWQILREGALVIAELARRARGRPFRGEWRREPFDPGREGAEGEARRAAATLFRSVAPNAYVVEVEDDHLLLHALVPEDRT